MTTTETIHGDLPTQEQEERNESGLVRGCIVKKWVGKWGPYLYAVTKKNGKQTWKYLGRADGLVRRRLHVEGPTTSEETDQQERML